VDSISLNTFKELLDDSAEKIAHRHTPIKVTGSQGNDFIVMSVADWESEQETLYILQNNSLIQQISTSLITHTAHQGYRPSNQEIDEIFSL
jgi:antitoxin YefM